MNHLTEGRGTEKTVVILRGPFAQARVEYVKKTFSDPETVVCQSLREFFDALNNGKRLIVVDGENCFWSHVFPFARAAKSFCCPIRFVRIKPSIGTDDATHVILWERDQIEPVPCEWGKEELVVIQPSS